MKNGDLTASFLLIYNVPTLQCIHSFLTSCIFPLPDHIGGPREGGIRKKPMAQIPSIEEMLVAGVHFGHQASRWHPKMEPFIFGIRNGIHIIDLEKTQEKLQETLAGVKRMAAEGKIILFISTKPQAKESVKAAALLCGMPYLVERWIGGLLTNFVEIRKLLKKYNSLKQAQASGGLERYTKKEQLDIAKDLEKMDKSLAGIAPLDRIPDVIFVPALQQEKTAVMEAERMEVSIVGIADTNADPTRALYFIPGNDDGVKSITMMVNLVAEAVKEGRAEYEEQKLKAVVKVVKSEAVELKAVESGRVIAEN